MKMNEKLIQFIWQFKYFNQSKIFTTEGAEIVVISAGMLNNNQGPDFSGARIKINDTLWAGNIETHVLSSDWIKHNHSIDKNYTNVILHVVWQNDIAIKDSNGIIIPTIELQNYVPKLLLEKYTLLMNANDFVPCEKQLPVLSDISWLAWKERLVAERLQSKSEIILQYLEQTNNNWEECFWWSLAKAFGAKVNAECFLQIAQSLSIKILGKHKNQIHQLEALLLGQSGLLNKKFTSPYLAMLSKEYTFLSKKYSLKPIQKQPAFLRMRPANFPSLRLAQLAMLIHQSSHLFSKIKKTKSPSEAMLFFNVTANDYWSCHYLAEDEHPYKPKAVGISFAQNILINTIAPIYYAYGTMNKDDIFKIKSINWLYELKPEKNHITNSWSNAGVINHTALDSQALIELKNSYCDLKKCLECAVGNKLLVKN